MDLVMYTHDDAPEDSKAGLDRVEAKYGFVPNLAATMAQSPRLLHAYLEVEEAFRGSALSPMEQEVVALTVSFENRCQYCMSAHSMLASMAGLGESDLRALRSGSSVATERLESLRCFVLDVMRAKGRVPEESVAAFLAAGYTRQQALAIPLGIAFKTLSNLTHHLQPVPLDDPMAGYSWEPSTSSPVRVLVSGWLNGGAGDALRRYQAAAGPIMLRHGGRAALKSRPGKAFVGDAPDLVVLIEFPSEDAAQAAFEDPDYLPLIPLRDEAFSRLDVITLDQ